MKEWQFDAILTSSQWISPGFLVTDDLGKIVSVSSSGKKADEAIRGWLIPGLANAHSHSFQYAMAGLTEYSIKSHKADDFWNWRTEMYRLANRITPEQLYQITLVAYCEMLRAGYTSVAEFHYLHHDQNGKMYSGKTDMSEAVIRAAKDAGINLTLIPVFYKNADFGKPLTEEQRRFGFSSTEEFLKFVELIESKIGNEGSTKLGIGVHSLRAADPADIKDLFGNAPQNYPLHIHIAEQEREVQRSIEYLKMRPVEWLLHNLAIGKQFHLVHATHMSDKETEALAKTGAVAVLCPSTEGNLGDGFFPLPYYLKHAGSWAIGSDSQICMDPFEELRWLDYESRLRSRQRYVFNRKEFSEGADCAFHSAWQGGNSAVGRSSGEFFQAGSAFDAIVLDSEHPVFLGKPLEKALSILIYAGSKDLVKDVFCQGKLVVRERKHLAIEAVRTKYTKAVSDLALEI